MTWTYSGDPSASDLDQYRFEITDTDESDPILQDEEIQYVLNVYAAVDMRLYQLFKAISDKFARDIKKALGPQSQDPTERVAYFKERMQYYRTRCQAAGMSVPSYSKPAAFSKGLHDNV